MKNAFLKLIVNIISFYLVVKFISGIQVDRWQTVVIAAVALTLVNSFLKPVIVLFTLPLNILSLGLFTFVINGFMFYLVSNLVKGFTITSFWSAIVGAFIFSIVSVILNLFIGPRENKVKFGFYSQDSSSTPQRHKYKDVIDVEATEEKNKIE